MSQAPKAKRPRRGRSLRFDDSGGPLWQSPTVGQDRVAPSPMAARYRRVNSLIQASFWASGISICRMFSTAALYSRLRPTRSPKAGLGRSMPLACRAPWQASPRICGGNAQKQKPRRGAGVAASTSRQDMTSAKGRPALVDRRIANTRCRQGSRCRPATRYRTRSTRRHRKIPRSPRCISSA